MIEKLHSGLNCVQHVSNDVNVVFIGAIYYLEERQTLTYIS